MSIFFLHQPPLSIAWTIFLLTSIMCEFDFPASMMLYSVVRVYFPYSYFNFLSRLQKSYVPPNEALSDDLSGAECPPEEYAHAQQTWSELRCKNFREYLTGCLHLNIYLLTGALERYREISFNEYGLDPIYFVSLPGLTFVSCFKKGWANNWASEGHWNDSTLRKRHSRLPHFCK